MTILPLNSKMHLSGALRGILDISRQITIKGGIIGGLFSHFSLSSQIRFLRGKREREAESKQEEEEEPLSRRSEPCDLRYSRVFGILSSLYTVGTPFPFEF